jgi:DNA-directed RNA polymerase sigma subunit (sigma70/sigma32)
VKASRRYDPERARFSTYATEWIRGRLLSFLSDWERMNQLPLQADGTQGVEPEAPAPDPSAAAAKEQVALMLRYLPRRWCELVSSIFGVGGRVKKTMAQAALEQGLTRQRAYQIVRKAMAKMREVAERAEAEEDAA